MAEKKGKLSKIELYFLQENPENLDEHGLAKVLNRPLKVVHKQLLEFAKNPHLKKKKKVKSDKLEAPLEVVEEPKKQTVHSTIKPQYAHNEKYGCTIMTPAASEMNDTLTGKGHQATRVNKGIKTNQAHIFKPKKGKSR